MVALSYCYVKKVAYPFINLANIIFLGECLANVAVKHLLIGCFNEHYGKRPLAVTPGSSCFLIIFLESVRDINMNHQTHIGLVNTHSKGIGSDNYSDFIIFPFVLLVFFLLNRQTGVIMVSADTLTLKFIGNQLCPLPASYIHNSRSRHRLDDVNEFRYFFGSAPNDV